MAASCRRLLVLGAFCAHGRCVCSASPVLGAAHAASPLRSARSARSSRLPYRAKLALSEAKPEARAAGPERTFAARPKLTLCALWTVYVCVQWSRGLLANSVSFQPEALTQNSRYVNAALGLSPQAYATLLAAFSCAYACASIPAGLVADVCERVPTLALSCGCWSLAMCLHAAATSASALMLSRLLHGAAAAFCSPVANSLIADAFGAEQRGGAYSVYASGLYVGTALAILGGGGLPLPRLGRPALQLGWRACAWAVAAASALAASVLLLGVPEPSRQGVPRARAPRSGLAAESARSVRRVLACRPALLSLCAVSVRMCAGYTIASWLPPHCKARFPGEERAFAALYASAVCGGGLLASLGGGFLSDAISRKSGRPHARAAVPLVGSLLAAPLFLMAGTRSSLRGTMLWFFMHVLCAEVWLGPTAATMLGSLPADARGMAQGLSNFVQVGAGLLQAAIAPAAAFFGLGRALLVTVPAAYVASAGVFAAVLLCREDEAETSHRSTVKGR